MLVLGKFLHLLGYYYVEFSSSLREKIRKMAGSSYIHSTINQFDSYLSPNQYPYAWHLPVVLVNDDRMTALEGLLLSYTATVDDSSV